MPNQAEPQISDTPVKQEPQADCPISCGIVRHSTCWLRPPFGQGEPEEVDAMPEVLVPLMVAGWSQCDPPTATEEVTEDVG